MEKNLNEVKDIIKEYQYHRVFRNYSVKYDEKIGNRFFGNINSNEDVERNKRYIENTISYYKTVYPLVLEDIDEIELAIGKYETTIHKIIQCYDNPHCDFYYSREELMELIDNIDKYNIQLGELKMRKVCQD
ncbi:hypothetical protein [Clostridium botulinum]|uniref:hypothetical protein n=1 Tax=Clostridium botulinum TaxID=1491 RepID=UPI0013F09D39|nr:hypothetical protein [Clostridium botulinum]MBY6809005.1 hypothetical protein [Clostridium botulinum]MBY6822290.1 hypothetical protein [Clostridium botulinum]MBY6832920.1 hypothetical protein [Clostridium botulinum]MBY6972148.1 hypothetical protein [Clostridium botulinum]MCS6107946.1 hypothetical protein [Clostridium botulinum]